METTVPTEEISEIEIVAPGVMPGHVVEVRGASVVVAEVVEDRCPGSAPSRLRVVRPGWPWRIRYRIRRSLRRAWSLVTRSGLGPARGRGG